MQRHAVAAGPGPAGAVGGGAPVEVGRAGVVDAGLAEPRRRVDAQSAQVARLHVQAHARHPVDAPRVRVDGGQHGATDALPPKLGADGHG